MITFLLVWYALSWIAVAIHCCHRNTNTLSLCDFFLILVSGGVGALFLAIDWLSETIPTCPIIWKRKQ